MEAALRSTIQAWLAEDPDPDTAQSLRTLAERAEGGDGAASQELISAFAGPLEFGTAGLRGPLGPGPARMNRVVVSRAAAGLARYLLAHDLRGRVLIGFDARHGSAQFARDTAEIMAGAGLEALLWERPVPTPLVAYGIRQLDCVAAVMVTASHNPAQDNGYKVYLGDGSQIVPPADTEIAAQIARVSALPLAQLFRSQDYRLVGAELEESYVRRCASLVEPVTPVELDWAYTPLHGVGGRVVERLVRAAGFPAPRIVAEQAKPDPEFPTTKFPNPEEPGVIDPVLQLGREQDADLVIANDPDADRCAVAVPAADGWRMLRGDELGALLGDDTLRRGARGATAASVVSGSMLARIAESYAQPFVTTLTGFKWIGRVPELVFGYEEAIGYCCDPDAVADKDGISTLLRVLQLAAELRAEGRTLADRLDELERRFGVHSTDQMSFRVAELRVIDEAMTRLRAVPPTSLAGQLVRFSDLAEGTPELPPTDGVRLSGDTLTATVRPSGTEPKLKCYLEARVNAAESHADLAAARDRARAMLATMRGELRQSLGL